jgi:hypothetical protein
VGCRVDVTRIEMGVSRPRAPLGARYGSRGTKWIGKEPIKALYVCLEWQISSTFWVPRLLPSKATNALPNC